MLFLNLGDLCFIPSIPSIQTGRIKHRTVCVFQDAFSRLLFLRFQKGTSSKETYKTFELSLPFFYANNVGKYHLFHSDKGNTNLFFYQYHIIHLSIHSLIQLIHLFFSSIFSGGEYKKHFLAGIRKDHGIKSYTTNTGIHPKVAIVERSIKSAKHIFFSLLMQFKTNNYENILELTQQIFNNRKHSAHNRKFTPLQCHHDTHVAAVIARFNSHSFRDHELQSRELFRSGKRKVFAVGQRVLIKVKKSPVHKKSSNVFAPNFTTKIFTIKSFDKSKFPPVYSMVELKDDSRKFYEHELQPVDELFQTLKLNNSKEKFVVQNVEEMNQPYLRSGLTPTDKKVFHYSVLTNKDKEPSLMTKEQLLNLKRLWGSKSITFSPTFDSPTMQKYVI